MEELKGRGASSPLPCGKPSRLKGKIDLSLGRVIGGGCVGSVSSLSGILLPSIASHTPPASGQPPGLALAAPPSSPPVGQPPGLALAAPPSCSPAGQPPGLSLASSPFPSQGSSPTPSRLPSLPPLPSPIPHRATVCPVGQATPLSQESTPAGRSTPR
ncbi:vegetative cell wall protein gp1-like [Portunus trituberculatus]|uniref:vegetative cell wall protein gp1-like n=1 Tax=Portunus trituberculatus TaxID=210409 RepID=UPI001E1CD812|nr:vegetative cell wall protein gp1-like [Portunus trituberculatus]